VTPHRQPKFTKRQDGSDISGRLARASNLLNNRLNKEIEKSSNNARSRDRSEGGFSRSRSPNLFKANTKKSENEIYTEGSRTRHFPGN
jgi:hypothetical protein